jgi:hypothetical protein
MHDFHAGREAENEAVVEDDGDITEGSSSDCDSSEDGYGSEDIEDETELSKDDYNIFSLFDGELDLARCDQPPQLFPAPSSFSPRIQDVLAEFDKHHLVGGMARQVAGVHTRGSMQPSVEGMSVEELRRWVDDSTTDSAQNGGNNHDAAIPSEAIERDTTVDEIIDHTLQPDQIQWKQVIPSATPPVTPMYCGIAEMSRHFTLNKLQYGAS